MELEDATWMTSAATITSNALLVKLLELEAMKEELLFYVDKMLGVVPDILKEQGDIIGYVEEGGRYYPVKDGKYIEAGGRRVSFSSLFELEEKAGGLKIAVEREVEKEGGGKEKVVENVRAFRETEKVKPVEAEVVYYEKKGKKYVVYEGSGGNKEKVEVDSLDDYIKERKAKAESLLKKGEYAKAAFTRAFLLKPKPVVDLSFLTNLFAWKYRKYRKGGKTPYERDFNDRITQFYLVPTGARYGGFMGLLYSKYSIPPEGTP